MRPARGVGERRDRRGQRERPAGPVVAGGMVSVDSGYGAFGQMPGNFVMAFGTGGPRGTGS